MAGQAVRGVQRIVVVYVAVGARRGLMRANQRETSDAVIKGSAVPALGRVAVGAIRGSERGARGGMDGSSGLLPLGQMASGIAAIRRSSLQRVIAIKVAGSAWNVSVPIGKQETRGAVIKFPVSPGGDGVASGAGGGCGCLLYTSDAADE